MKLYCQERDYLTEYFQYSQKSDIRNNSIKLADISSIRPASSNRLTERQEAVAAWDCVALCKLHLRYKREAENDLVVRHSEYSETSMDCMGTD